jgi:DNA polymerase-3 subunit chi
LPTISKPEVPVRADFYHLVASPLETVLPRICERVLTEGQRLVVVAEPAQLDALDEQLWSFARGSFLPHGRAGQPHAERQPLLLSSEPAPVNDARNIALIDGHWRDEALSFDRIFYFFDATRLDEARASWRALKDREDVERHYWKQDGGGRWIEGP